MKKAYYAMRHPSVLRMSEAGDFLTLRSVLIRASTMELSASLGHLALKKGFFIRLNVMEELSGPAGLVKKSPVLFP